MTPSPDLAILRHLAARTHAGAAEIGIALRMTAAEVRARLVMLESMRLIAGRSDPTAGERSPRRVYVITGEGRRKAEISDVPCPLRLDRRATREGIPPGKDGAKDAARSETVRRWPGMAERLAYKRDGGRAEAALIAAAGKGRQ